jgi:hypothetical protein
MHVITLNGKPVTLRMIALYAKKEGHKGWDKGYIIAPDAKNAKKIYLSWFDDTWPNSPMIWKHRPKGIECRRLTKEDVI